MPASSQEIATLGEVVSMSFSALQPPRCQNRVYPSARDFQPTSPHLTLSPPPALPQRATFAPTRPNPRPTPLPLLPPEPLHLPPSAAMTTDEETSIYDEIELEDLSFDKATQLFTYPCPCGDRFEIFLDDLRDGQDVAVCPSCSLMVRVIFEPVRGSSTTNHVGVIIMGNRRSCARDGYLWKLGEVCSGKKGHVFFFRIRPDSLICSTSASLLARGRLTSRTISCVGG